MPRGRGIARLCGLLALVCLGVSLISAPVAAASARPLRVAVYANPPKLVLGQDGQPSGILGDLLREMAEQEGWSLQAVECEFEACLQALREGRVDILPDLAYTAARADEFDLHATPALNSWSQLYRHPDSDINSMVDMGGRRIAVLAGSVQEDYLGTLAEGFGLKVHWKVMSNLDQAVEEVIAGRADAVATNHHYGDWAAVRRGLQQTGVIFMPARLFYAVPKGSHADLLATFDRYLQRWQGDTGSVYYRTLRQWGAPPPVIGLPGYLPWVVLGVFAAFAGALGLVFWLRGEVARKSRSLTAGEERLATILNSVDAHIYIKDAGLRYRYVNHKFSELLGMTGESILGRTDQDLFDDATARLLQANDLAVIEGGERVACEETKRTRDGSKQGNFFSIKLPLRDADGRVTELCGISTDISEQHELLSEIHQLAYFDPLTHLPNRQQMLDRLRNALAACGQGAQQGALLLLNLDRFQELNDTRGHDVGDEWLQQVAQRVVPCLHEGQSIARLGADEFAFLMPHLPGSTVEAQRQVAALAQHLLESVAAPAQLAGQDYHGSCGIGIALFADPELAVEEVLKQADIALSQAKIAGSKRMRFFQPEMQTAIAARAALESDLRSGLAESQFLLHYQPQVDLDGRLLGVEALVRWQHPQRGLVAPSSFIPLAEASGLILPLGHWVLTQACSQLAQWKSASATAGLRIAVNISARQLHHPQFVDEVLTILADTGAPANRLELELTESQLVEDIDEAIGKLGALRQHGVRIALDDFGTGYSALSYVKRLPLDLLKIDTSFIRDLLLDPNDMAIVRTIIALGNSLRLDVLAEGVEESAQRDVLSELGCRQFQGFLFGMPVAVDALDLSSTRSAG